MLVREIILEAKSEYIEPSLFALKIAQLESEADWQNKNPKSTAFGLYQFLEKTFKDLVAQVTDPKDFLYGKTWPDYQTDVNVQTAAMNKIEKQYDNLLRAKGLPLTDGNKYVIHFLGPIGATALAKNWTLGQAYEASVGKQKGRTANPGKKFTLDRKVRDMAKVWDTKMAGVDTNRVRQNVIAALDQEPSTATKLASKDKPKTTEPDEKIASADQAKQPPAEKAKEQDLVDTVKDALGKTFEKGKEATKKVVSTVKQAGSEKAEELTKAQAEKAIASLPAAAQPLAQGYLQAFSSLTPQEKQEMANLVADLKKLKT